MGSTVTIRPPTRPLPAHPSGRTSLDQLVNRNASAASPARRVIESSVVIDSDMTLDRALDGIDIPDHIRSNLAQAEVEYRGFDGRRHRGQIVVARELVPEVEEIFRDIEASGFPIARAIPVARYGWSDEASMLANNTSGFNYRRVPGMSKLSKHATGHAIDINPLFNPYIRPDLHEPPGSRYRPGLPGVITAGGPVVRAFRKRGWRWGGFFQHGKDWQHFDKT